METSYSNKGLARLLAQARSDIDNGQFENAREIANYIESLGYEMTGCAIRHAVHTVQKTRGISEG